MLPSLRLPILVSSLSLVLSIFSACSPVSFKSIEADKPGTPQVQANPPPTHTCTRTNVGAITRMTKLIFLVDVSGSNALPSSNHGMYDCTGGGPNCTPPTDPTKSFRGGALSDFLARYRHKTNFQWSMATFAADASRALINSGSDQNPVFSADPNQMQYALNTFFYARDNGNTPYKAALAMAHKAVQNDPDLRSPAKPNYLVILLTDGFPTDYKNPNDPYSRFQWDAVGRDIDAIQNLAPGQVNLSTIYYGTMNDPDAIRLLREMAVQGGGQFASVNDPNSGFKIDDVIPGSQNGCP